VPALKVGDIKRAVGELEHNGGITRPFDASTTHVGVGRWLATWSVKIKYHF